MNARKRWRCARPYKKQHPPGEEDPAGVVITAFDREEEIVGLSVRAWEEDDPDEIW